MSKKENNFKEFVDYINNLDDKDWYTWYLNDEKMRIVCYNFLNYYTRLVAIDYSRGVLWASLSDSITEPIEDLCQDITTFVKEVIKKYDLIGNSNRKNKCRSKEVTKTQLEDLGVVYVTEDGDVYAYNGEEVVKKTPFVGSCVRHKYSTNKKRYLYLSFYNSITHKYTVIALHRIVYAWFNGVARAGMTIDHIDNNEQNNSINNLREVTLEENLSYKKIGRNQYSWDLSDEEILSRRYEIENKRELKKEQKKINKDIDKQVEELNIKIKNKLEYLHALEEGIQDVRQRKNDGNYEGYLEWRVIRKLINETKNDIKRLKDMKKELLSKKISFKN